MVNRLLINMQNKIDVISESIKMMHKLQKGESVTVGKVEGCREMTFVMKEGYSMQEFNEKIDKLVTERENLQIRVDRMTRN